MHCFNLDRSVRRTGNRLLLLRIRFLPTLHGYTFHLQMAVHNQLLQGRFPEHRLFDVRFEQEVSYLPGGNGLLSLSRSEKVP